MYPRTALRLCQLGARSASNKSSRHVNNFISTKNPAPELASLPPATHLRSLQRLRVKRGTIKPILNNERIKPGALVDPNHPAAKLDNKSFHAPYKSNDYFNARAYPNVMLKRLGVEILPNGRLRPRPPPERDFPIFKEKKRAKLARTYIMPIKTTHKSAVVRVRLKRKLNEAIQLVVTRGADADPEGRSIVFKQSEALESKWILRDWYYVFYPRTPIYHAPWPTLIKAVRETLSAIVQKGSEMDMDWNLNMAEREAKAMVKLSRREMRRVRMWRRQDQEAAMRGSIAEDVGVRWKQKGMGVKKRPTPRTDNRKVKMLRAPSRCGFQEGTQLSPKPRTTAAEPNSTVPRLGSRFAGREPCPVQSQVVGSMRSFNIPPTQKIPRERKPQVLESRTQSTTVISEPSPSKSTPTRTPGARLSPKPSVPNSSVSRSLPVEPTAKPQGRIYTKPPSPTLLGALRRGPQPEAPESNPASVNYSSRKQSSQKSPYPFGKRSS